jgi:hypothetical protein
MDRVNYALRYWMDRFDQEIDCRDAIWRQVDKALRVAGVSTPLRKMKASGDEAERLLSAEACRDSGGFRQDAKLACAAARPQPDDERCARRQAEGPGPGSLSSRLWWFFWKDISGGTGSISIFMRQIVHQSKVRSALHDLLGALSPATGFHPSVAWHAGWAAPRQRGWDAAIASLRRRRSRPVTAISTGGSWTQSQPVTTPLPLMR